jgi:glycosyltransferase involved in cell wall biosynthesis
MPNKILCVIPAYNAEPTLASVVLRVRNALPDATILTVDDGSTDETRMIARSVSDHTIEFDENQGKGAALRAAFAFAVERGFDAVLTIDADAQHDPAFAPALVRALDHADVVIGTREIGGRAVPLHRRVSNLISSAVTRAVAGADIRDSQSGYRAVRTEVLRHVNARGKRYEFETDFLIMAARKGFRFAAVPISTVYGTPTASNFRPIRDAIRVLRVLGVRGIFQRGS